MQHPFPSSAPQALAQIGFDLFQGYVFENHPQFSACVQSLFHSQSKKIPLKVQCGGEQGETCLLPKREDKNLPSEPVLLPVFNYLC